MEFDQNKYQNYVRILNEELVPAMGCTEPIAIAYCAALMKGALGNNPSKVIINVSGNVIKNVKSVTVPNTLGLCGIDTACAVGIIAGDASKKLEVIANVSKEECEKLALANERVQKFLEGLKVIKVIVVPQKLVNIVAK